MNKIYSYLFFVENDQIIIIQKKADSNQTENDEKLEYLTEKGENNIEIKDIEKQGGFWQWWKRKAGFSSESGTDFCFIYDKKYEFIEDSPFENIGESIWNISYIENFFDKIKSYRNLCLIDRNGNECLIRKGNLEFADNSLRRFHTNLDLKSSRKKRSSFDEQDISPIAQYFINLMESEQKSANR